MMGLPDSDQRHYNLKLFHYQKYVIESDLEINVYKSFKELYNEHEKVHGDYSKFIGTNQLEPKMIDRYDWIMDQIKKQIYKGENGNIK
jgi:hypothetical protein